MAEVAVEVQLHPLVVLNLNDHYTRHKAVTKGSVGKVFGVILGTLHGRKVEMHTSFEQLMENKDGKLVPDWEFLLSKLEHVKQVYKEYEVLGWYSTGTKLTQEDETMLMRLRELNENPLVLLMNPEVDSSQKSVPISIFEVNNAYTGEKAQHSFSPINYVFHSEESERLGVELATHLDDKDAQTSALLRQVSLYRDAIGMLQRRVQLATAYLDEVKAGKIQPDFAVLRPLLGMVNQLPAMDGFDFAQGYNSECHDALLVSYLSTLTKGNDSLNRMTETFNNTYDKQRRRMP